MYTFKYKSVSNIEKKLIHLHGKIDMNADISAYTSYSSCGCIFLIGCKTDPHSLCNFFNVESFDS